MREEMDLESDCKEKLASFRIKELKDVLTRLGISKQGRKQDLVDKILCSLSEEEVSTARGSAKKNGTGRNGVAKIIDEVYRKMTHAESADLERSSLKPEEAIENSINTYMNICCPCGNSVPTESMIQCVDPTCRVQQHIGCVIISEKPMEIPPIPSLFYCATCRIKRADPFWVTVKHLLPPKKLFASSIPTDGANPLRLHVDENFQLTTADRDPEYNVQVWCLLLNDHVSFRMQWPQHAELQVNGITVRTVNRPGSQLLGANGRDDGALITVYEGINNISLSGCDARGFCFGIRLVQRLSVQQVLNLIPREEDGELIEDALARVRRCTGGGVAAANNDSDSDVEVIADSITVNLRCPMSGSRMKVAGRFKPCVHMGCFDLETFVELNERSRKWQCPICLKNYSLEDVIIDPYFNRITTMMRNCGEDMTEINVKPDGSWSAKTRGEYSDLAQWHFPDGSLYIAKDEATSNLKSLRQIKQEDVIEEHRNLKICMEKNHNGVTISKHQHIVLSSRNQEENCENSDLNVIMMSSSSTGSDRDDENPSISQDRGGNIDICAIDGNEINSIPHNSDPAFGILNGRPALREDAAIIVLSDSEEEDDRLCSFVEDSALNADETSCLGLFNGNASGNSNGNGNEIGFSHWPYASGTQAGPGLQLFGTDSDVSDAFIDLEHTSISSSAPMNCIGGASRLTVNSGGQVLNSSVCHNNNEIDNGLVENPLAFVNEDPSLQNFLPNQPADMLEQANRDHQHSASNGFEDWISLRVGRKGEEGVDSDVEVPAVSPAANGLDLRNQSGSNEAAINAHGNDETGSNRTSSRKLSDGPFSFPRQPRSVRQRVCLSIDSD
ncbi:E3 SUMO-protein ligase SIZ1-like isoform X1 [Quercus robur]|uniref:E3 SUMO-protein ligase SIZ1-like isoform X1 n=1 Tax=Quercus robur TaxID=38942 RepID=UPI0021619FC9|nr:E3 SUMO-protein ligase SIZ1-like isoform X1 [Quercus robur]